MKKGLLLSHSSFRQLVWSWLEIPDTVPTSPTQYRTRRVFFFSFSLSKTTTKDHRLIACVASVPTWRAFSSLRILAARKMDEARANISTKQGVGLGRRFLLSFQFARGQNAQEAMPSGQFWQFVGTCTELQLCFSGCKIHSTFASLPCTVSRQSIPLPRSWRWRLESTTGK